MRKARRKAIAVVLYVSAAVTLVIAVIPLFRNPDPLHFQVTLPERAEVLPAERVQPGTFKLTLPWSDIKDHAEVTPFNTIVSFGNAEVGAVARVEAYQPRGDSTFYYARVDHTPDWPYGFRVGRVKRAGNHFTAYPDWSGGSLTSFTLLATILVFAGLLVDPWTSEFC